MNCASIASTKTKTLRSFRAASTRATRQPAELAAALVKAAPDAISERTKAALAAAKARGKKLGSPIARRDGR
jgi:DNA invertase Pin-like site-specific DNA recombinase